MRLTLALVLYAVTAHAQATTTHLVLPAYAGVGLTPWQTTANQMVCWRIPARLGITNATKFAAATITASSPGVPLCSWAIYADSNSGARLAVLSTTCNTAAVKTNSAVPAFSLVQGTTYRFCVCNTAVNGTYLGVVDFSADFTGGDFSGDQTAVLNGTLTSHGAVATNSCIAGVPQATTGALTTEVTQLAPIILVEQ